MNMYLVRFNFFAIREEFYNNNFDSSPFGKLVKVDNTWVYIHTSNKKALDRIEKNIHRYLPFWFVGASIVIEAINLNDCFLKFLEYLSYGYIYQEKEFDYWTFINEILENQKEQSRLVLENDKTIPFPLNELNFENWPIEIISISAFKNCPLMNKKDGIIFCCPPAKKISYSFRANDLCCITCENLYLLDDKDSTETLSEICIQKKLVSTFEPKNTGEEKTIQGKPFIFFDCIKKE